MLVGAKVALESGETGIVKHRSCAGLYTVTIKGRKEKQKGTDVTLRPIEVLDFLKRELMVLRHMAHFCASMPFFRNLTPCIVDECDSNINLTARAGLDDDHVQGSLFFSTLAIWKNDFTPDLFLKPTSTAVCDEPSFLKVQKSTKHLYVVLEHPGCRGVIFGNKSSSHLHVFLGNISEPSTVVYYETFDTLHDVYCLSPALMFCLMEDSFFKQLFKTNVMNLRTFDLAKHPYEYDRMNRLITFSKDDTRFHIISLFAPISVFVIMSKVTFNTHRHAILNLCIEEQVSLPLKDLSRRDITHKTPVQFLHVQFMSILHVMDYMVRHGMQETMERYSEMVAHILIQLENHTLPSEIDQAFAVDLLQKKVLHDCFMDDEPLHEIFSDAHRQHAFFSNVEHVIYAYHRILEMGVVSSLYVKEYHCAIINDVLVPSFIVDPLHIQIVMFRIERNGVAKAMHLVFRRTSFPYTGQERKDEDSPIDISTEGHP